MTFRILRVILVTLAILCVPLVVMQFTREVTWTAFDFAIAAALLVATGLVYEFAVRPMHGARRFTFAAGLALAFLLVWAQLAVGLFN